MLVPQHPRPTTFTAPLPRVCTLPAYASSSGDLWITSPEASSLPATAAADHWQGDRVVAAAADAPHPMLDPGWGHDPCAVRRTASGLGSASERWE